MSSAPPVQRFEHWTLVSPDVERSRDFYTEVLGATVPKRNGGPTSVVLANTIIDIFPDRGRPQPAPGGPGYHHAYLISLDDFDPWVEHLRQHHVTVEMRTHGLHRMSIYLNDPDGNQIEFTVPFEDDELGRREIEKRGLLPKSP
ncbi:MAG: VOC family protein [Chloroflexota bacterium]